MSNSSHIVKMTADEYTAYMQWKQRRDSADASASIIQSKDEHVPGSEGEPLPTVVVAGIGVRHRTSKKVHTLPALVCTTPEMITKQMIEISMQMARQVGLKPVTGADGGISVQPVAAMLSAGDDPAQTKAEGRRWVRIGRHMEAIADYAIRKAEEGKSS